MSWAVSVPYVKICTKILGWNHGYCHNFVLGKRSPQIWTDDQRFHHNSITKLKTSICEYSGYMIPAWFFYLPFLNITDKSPTSEENKALVSNDCYMWSVQRCEVCGCITDGKRYLPANPVVWYVLRLAMTAATSYSKWGHKTRERMLCVLCCVLGHVHQSFFRLLSRVFWSILVTVLWQW